MKIVQEHSCFPLQRNFEISGGIFFVYIWCSPKSLKLTIVEDKLFKTDFRIHTLPAKLNYGHQQRIIIYLWGCPNQQHMQSHPILCVLKNISFFIKKKLTQQNQVFALATEVCSLSKQHKTKLLHTLLRASYRWDLQDLPKRQMRANH